MGNGLYLRAAIACVGLVLSLGSARAAVTYDVTITSGSLAGPPAAQALLDFIFINGDATLNNTVTLSTLSSPGGTQDSQPCSAAYPCTGAVSGTGPWTFDDSEFFNELAIEYTLGTTLSFSFTPTNNFAGGVTPDSFTFYMWDRQSLPVYVPLVPTDSLENSNALFALDLGSGADGPTIYSQVDGIQGFSIGIVARNTVPEPGTLFLFSGAVLIAMTRRRGASVLF